jgi:hypothetical protein
VTRRSEDVVVVYSRQFIEANVRALQEFHGRGLRADVINSYMNGTPNPHATKDDGFDRRLRRDGKTVDGRTLYRMKTERRDREGVPGFTLHLVWQMRNAGWSEDDTRAMMLFAHEAKGTQWLREHRDPEGEFRTCWEKAGRSAHAINSDSRRSDHFACNQQDIERVYTFVESLTDAGESWSQRDIRTSKNVLDGKHKEGRIVWCLKWLVEEGFLTFDVGARGAHLYRAVTLSKRVVHNPVGGQSTERTGEDTVIDVSTLEEAPEEPSMSDYERGWLDGYLKASADAETLRVKAEAELWESLFGEKIGL